MPLTGHLVINQLFGLYASKLSARGDLETSSIPKDSYQQIVGEWISTSSFSQRTPLISSTEGGYYISDFMIDEFFDDSM